MRTKSTPPAVVITSGSASHGVVASSPAVVGGAAEDGGADSTSVSIGEVVSIVCSPEEPALQAPSDIAAIAANATVRRAGYRWSRSVMTPWCAVDGLTVVLRRVTS